MSDSSCSPAQYTGCIIYVFFFNLIELLHEIIKKSTLVLPAPIYQLLSALVLLYDTHNSNVVLPGRIKTKVYCCCLVDCSTLTNWKLECVGILYGRASCIEEEEPYQL
jgi:hypothetical protein